MEHWNNKDLPYSTGNYIQYLVITCNRKESEKIDMCVCITESLCCIPETNTTLWINYTLIKDHNNKVCFKVDGKGCWERQGELWEAVSVSRWEEIWAETGVTAKSMVRGKGNASECFRFKLGKRQVAGDFQTGSSRPASRPSDPLLLTLAPRPLGESCHHGAAARQDSSQQPVWKHCSRWWQPGGVPVTWL